MDEPIRARGPSESPDSNDEREAFAGYLDELERLCRAATPGPWTLDEHGDGLRGPGGAPIAETWGGTRRLADARFIEAARHALPKLIAEVRRIAELEQLHERRVRVLMRMAGPVCFTCNAKRKGTQCADCLGELWEDEDGVRHAG